MNYTEFEQRAAQSGLRTRRCSQDHWQLLGGIRHPILNVWPYSKRGFRYQTGSEKSLIGTPNAAITLAGVVVTDLSPWEELPILPTERVGLIRWIWRLIW